MASDPFLDQPLFDDALKAPYFFNGRMLTQEDLTQEQAAQLAQKRRLGRALGSGVAYGLEVVKNDRESTALDIVLDVSAGLAVAPGGDTLHLPQPVHLHFAVQASSLAETASGDGAGEFGDCGAVTSTVAVAQSGVYVLAIRTAAGKQGLATVSGLGNEAAPCNTKYRTSGVTLRAIPLASNVVVSAPGLLRNAIARDCFGFFDGALATAVADPIAAPSVSYGKIEALRASGDLSDCDVPLAIVHLSDQGALDFVDMWSVRRPLLRPAFSQRWPLGGSDDRRRAEGEAAMMCFQDQIASLLGSASLETVVAATRFSFLPGGGFLPVGAGRFNAATFLGPTAKPAADADFGRLRWMVEESWRCDPIDLAPRAVLPPMTYFEFAEAAGAWVFFLRRPPELDVGSDTDSEDPVDAGKVKSAKLLVAVAASWVKKNGTPTARLSAGLAKPESDPTFTNVVGIEALRKLGETILKNLITKKLMVTAQFISAEDVRPDRYQLTVSGSLERAEKFSRPVTLTTSQVLLVVVE